MLNIVRFMVKVWMFQSCPRFKSEKEITQQKFELDTFYYILPMENLI